MVRYGALQTIFVAIYSTANLPFNRNSWVCVYEVTRVALELPTALVTSLYRNSLLLYPYTDCSNKCAALVCTVPYHTCSFSRVKNSQYATSGPARNLPMRASVFKASCSICRRNGSDRSKTFAPRLGLEGGFRFR